jgi:hypothetical protein
LSSNFLFSDPTKKPIHAAGNSRYDQSLVDFYLLKLLNQCHIRILVEFCNNFISNCYYCYCYYVGNWVFVFV